GEIQFNHLLFLAEDRVQGQPLSREALIQSCLKQPCPSWLAAEGALLKLTPFSPGTNPSVAGLLEWLPKSSSDSGREKLKIFQEVSQAVNSSLILEDIFEALGDVL